MIEAHRTNLETLVAGATSRERARRLLEAVDVADELLRPASKDAARSEIAMALDLLLLEDVLRRVPMAAAYVRDLVRRGGRIAFDHGALRTIAAKNGALPGGAAAFRRILEPIGYAVAGTYPLDRLGMTGYAFAHLDLPQEVPQYFVSELHPERFSAPFQEATRRVFGDSREPIGPDAAASLARLARKGVLPVAEAIRLLPELAAAFDRQHAEPTLSDYETLREESREAAWIATEGNAFNHATDRVADVAAVAESQILLGRPMKERLEVSASGRVVQTAFRAAVVARLFVGENGALVERSVPGSFFEFITRREEAPGRLDLRFDTSNAQAIFRMTAAA